ncbi:MAG: bifunctional riboflavin kinase/FAD synthetase [Gemmatimonadota bacterium]|nr:bifunctional riboflavin kinase/FAD synthetase [Gemmatimonadota bacterium]MDH3427568.1 bifunctional riboflavin kinase/FAD synthetase [Gemmatimonadota bacterium]
MPPESRGRIARSGLPTDVGGTVVTVGTFDGVHRGHQAVLEEIEVRAERRNLFSVLVTFDRHPLTVVRPEDSPELLTTPDEKKAILAQTGLDYVAFLPFTKTLSRYTPQQFIRLVLLERFRVAELVIGWDHGFGRSRSGSIETARRLGKELGFAVDVVPAVISGKRSVSSTSIRACLANGDVQDAWRQLGRPYSFRGPVIHGFGRGRDLGFPTANIRAPGGRKLLPKAGIYAVRASLRNEIREGLLHLGPRPTFVGSPPSIELYLLDFDRDVYGEDVQVDFLTRLRDVEPFASTAELISQMQRDRERALEYFAAQGLQD